MEKENHADTVEHGSENTSAKILHHIACFPRNNHRTHEDAIGIVRKIGNQIPDSNQFQKGKTDPKGAGGFSRQHAERGKTVRNGKVAQQCGRKTVMDQRERAAESQEHLKIKHG
jgi:hypothetical protein